MQPRAASYAGGFAVNTARCKNILLFLLIFLSTGQLWAQNELSLDIIVTKDPSGEGVPRYAPGDALRIGIMVSHDAYVYLFEIDDNKLIAIHPNQYDNEQHKFFRAAELYTIPPAGADYQFILNDLQAERRIVGLATPNPLAPAILDRLEHVSDLQGGVWALDAVRFSVGEANDMNLTRPISISKRPKQQSPTDNLTPTLNNVNNAPKTNDTPQLLSPIMPDGQLPSITLPSNATNPTSNNPVSIQPINTNPVSSSDNTAGNFQITSVPTGAEVFVDNIRMGVTPLFTNVNAGIHTIVLRLIGYKEVSFPLEIRSDQDSIVETYLVQDPDSLAAIEDANEDTGQDFGNADNIHNQPISIAPSPSPIVVDAPDSLPNTTNLPDASSSLSAPEANRSHVTIQGNIRGADVYLDNRGMGQLNELGSLTLYNIFAGERLISLRAEGYYPLEERHYFPEGEHLLELVLRPLQANNQVAQTPAAATPNPATPNPATPAPSNDNATFSTAPIPSTAPSSNTAPTTNTPTTPLRNDLSAFASPTFGLRNYPEANLLNIVESSNRADSYLESIVPAVNLYAFFESQLVSYGWQQTGINETANAILGDYQQGAYQLRMEVATIGTNLFRLTLYRY